MDEVFGSLRRNRPDLDPTALTRTRKLMVCAVRDCLVSGYEPLMAGIELPDPEDRHVLAAAIRARAQIIVTNNLKDFPPERLIQWDIEPKGADEFVLDQIDLNAKVVWGCVQQIADAWRNPPGRAEDVLRSLERDGLLRSVAELQGR